MSKNVYVRMWQGAGGSTCTRSNLYVVYSEYAIWILPDASGNESSRPVLVVSLQLQAPLSGLDAYESARSDSYSSFATKPTLVCLVDDLMMVRASSRWKNICVPEVRTDDFYGTFVDWIQLHSKYPSQHFIYGICIRILHSFIRVKNFTPHTAGWRHRNMHMIWLDLFDV